MEKEFLKYTEALALKELGFNEQCFSTFIYKVPELQWELNFVISDNRYIGTVASPTFSQAFRWFREKYNLYQDISTFVWNYDKEQLGFSLRTYLNPLDTTTEKKVHPEVYETYEEAELECLKKLIEIVKEKK